MDIFVSFYVTTTHGFTEKSVMWKTDVFSITGAVGPGARLPLMDSFCRLETVSMDLYRSGEGRGGEGEGGGYNQDKNLCVSKQGRPDL